jgi:hypothetical protein
MTAGSSTATYRTWRVGPHGLAVVVIAGMVLGLVALSAEQLTTGGQLFPEPVAQALLGWERFQADCVAGPSEGQGFGPGACVCWEGQLQAEATQPAYAVHVLLAAQAGGDRTRSDVVQNLAGNGRFANATSGCGI